MKNRALLLLAATWLQFFCLPMQQSRAQTNEDLVSGDILDSDAYFRSTVQRPRLANYTTQIEALLRKMTLEEKVGQMTQLEIDRKSTRLNSSHRCISYAVFCLKKKKKK